ncbi:MAG: divalent-cation tolerance protein CutA [Opitutales bacterium]|jgi:periplasmic divalent cation tolerance protein
MKDHLLIGWTTVGSAEVAQQLACELVESGLAACVQIDREISSVYQWEGHVCQEREWRLQVKFLESKSEALLEWIDRAHPYSTPEWVVVTPTQVAAKYDDWVRR